MKLDLLLLLLVVGWTPVVRLEMRTKLFSCGQILLLQFSNGTN